MRNKGILMAAAILGTTGVILGALGAHALEKVLPAESVASFVTGVRYQMYHALALLALAFAPKNLKGVKTIASLWIIGTVFFSLSIYLLSTAAITGSELSWLGPVTPVGGLLLISGWALLFVNSWRS